MGLPTLPAHSHFTLQEERAMNPTTGLTRLFRVDSRADEGRDADFYSSVLVIEDQLELCCLLRQADPARAFIRRQLEYVVRVFNLHPTRSAQTPERCSKPSRRVRKARPTSRRRFAAIRWRRSSTAPHARHN
jgi:hypothetical protein